MHRWLHDFLIPIISGATALGGVWLAQRKQAKQETLKDRRALRDQKRERLRQQYEKAILAARSFLESMPEIGSIRPAEQRYREFVRVHEEKTEDLKQTRISLKLDSNGEKALCHLDSLIEGFVEYHVHDHIFSDPTHDPTPEERDAWSKKSVELIRKMRVELEALEVAAREDLGELEKPIEK